MCSVRRPIWRVSRTVAELWEGLDGSRYSCLLHSVLKVWHACARSESIEWEQSDFDKMWFSVFGDRWVLCWI